MSHYVEEFYDVYDERRRRARKRAPCSACGEPIYKGDFYTRVFTVYDGEIESLRRCERCQTIHVHLRTLCERAGDMAPDERLACGIEYKKHWNVDPPPELAALAFWRPGDPIGAIPVPEGAHPSDDFDY